MERLPRSPRRRRQVDGEIWPDPAREQTVAIMNSLTERMLGNYPATEHSCRGEILDVVVDAWRPFGRKLQAGQESARRRLSGQSSLAVRALFRFCLGWFDAKQAGRSYCDSTKITPALGRPPYYNVAVSVNPLEKTSGPRVPSSRNETQWLTRRSSRRCANVGLGRAIATAVWLCA